MLSFRSTLDLEMISHVFRFPEASISFWIASLIEQDVRLRYWIIFYILKKKLEPSSENSKI